MKLLITSGDFSRWHSRGFSYLLTELAKICELYVWYESGDISEIIEKIGEEPDFVFINEFGETNSHQISGLASLTTPYAIYLFDLHHEIEQRKEAMERANVKHIFTHYRDKFYEWYPEFWRKMRWLPLHANTDIFKDYALPKDIDYLLMGAVGERIYPLRYKVRELMRNKPGFICHEHAGYRNFEEDEEALVGERYAREINRAKMFFTCNSVYDYPLGKYFEVPACHTLLMAPSSREILDLGFEPGVNFVAIGESDFLEKAEYYLNHKEERELISKRGYEMVRSRHSTSRRAFELIAMIEEILAAEGKKPLGAGGGK
ncbi:MAG TPA: glycosyltransferase [Syntrophomonadaceae bacterium]|nr:glycosyltransferase [Syntrophomonadaceae bacterium]